MSYGPYQLKVGNLTLEVVGTYERDGRSERMWVDEVRLQVGDKMVDLGDLLEAVQKDRPSWYWADWAGEQVIADIRRSREAA
jgi:hypothetical protein